MGQVVVLYNRLLNCDGQLEGSNVAYEVAFAHLAEIDDRRGYQTESLVVYQTSGLTHRGTHVQ